MLLIVKWLVSVSIHLSKHPSASWLPDIPVFFHLYNYSIRSSNCSVIFLWWFTNMVFKDYLYFQINKFMEKRAWPVLFLFLTTILQKSTLKFLVDPMDISITWVTKGFAPDPSFYQALLHCFPGKSWLPAWELLCSCCNHLLWGKQPPHLLYSSPPQNASSVISFPHHPILSISSEHQTSIKRRVSLHKCICYSPHSLTLVLATP